MRKDNFARLGEAREWFKDRLLPRLSIPVPGFRRLGRLSKRFVDWLVPLLSLPAPEPSQLLKRITMMELHIILPLKAAGVSMLLYSFYSSRWIGGVLGALEISVEWTQYFLWFYIGANLVLGSLLLFRYRLSLNGVNWVVFASCLLDSLFLSALTLVTGGYDSILYWLFLALIVRSAVSVPRTTSQLMLNLTLSACYVMAGVIDIAIAENLDEESRISSGLTGDPGAAEPLLLRLVLLLLMTVCSYGVQLLLERQRQAEAEAREFALREGQLRSAGRMAAEFAHQIKNPLGIINNAAFSLERALKNGRPAFAEQQIQIIQEEVERSDRIITQVMGYAQLSEGRVERVNVIEELDLAIDRVFPAAAGYPVAVRRDYGDTIPALLMQRRHVSESFLNLLQNAREALEGRSKGHVHVRVRAPSEYSVEVTIADDGPGIPADKHERIFQAYYSTREKGTGLGLATVKHNVELYGGTVRLESELGKGARFILVFPARLPSSVPAPM